MIKGNPGFVSISIIIPTWNNDATLSKTLKALTRQTFQDFEVILIDNGSASFDATKIIHDWPSLKIQIIALQENTGFTHACNLGAQEAAGEWLAMLNADAYPFPDWLEQFHRYARQYPDAASFCSLIIQASNPDLLDGTGDVYNISGNAWKRGAGYPLFSAPQKPERVFSANAAASFYRRDIFLAIGGFDEDFFSYFEDVDLGFRLNLAGYPCYYLPTLQVEHVGSSSTGRSSDFTIYHHHRNLEWCFWKNMPGFLCFLYFPLHLLSAIVFFFKYLLKGRGGLICRAKIDALKSFENIRRKRKGIQSQRNISLSQLNRLFDKRLFAPYLLGYNLRKYTKTIHSRKSLQ